MRFPKRPSFLSFSKLSSSTPTKNTQSAPVGASAAQIGADEYYTYEKMNKWIEETKRKIPVGTPSLREEAFKADPLIRGTILPYLLNTLLQGFTIQTADNKLYAEAIKDIYDYLNQINLMQVFREDFPDYMFKTGHTYRRMDPDKDGNIISLGKIEPSSVETFNDPWDSSIIAYHQHAKVKTTWSTLGTTIDVDSWFIPYGKTGPDIASIYIQNENPGNGNAVYDLFEQYQKKYSITDISNLRIGASERIIAMNKTQGVKTTKDLYDDYYGIINNEAPIDSVILSIWLKRLLLSNAPHLIYIVINPFLHLKSGIIKEAKDAVGNPSLISSVPQKPSTHLQAANQTIYNDMLQNFENWIHSLESAQKNIIKCVKDGGVFASGPDVDLKPVESSRNVSYLFIKNLIEQLNEEIGQAFGFPMALVNATGTELASSRNILQMYNSVHAGERTDYEAVANKLIKMQFEGKTWTVKTTKEYDSGAIEEVEEIYSFEDMQAHFVLDVPDTKDLLQEAQTINTRADTLNKLKTTGASKDDIIALGDEYGFGLLGLDNYDILNTDDNQEGVNETDAAQINNILKACLLQVIQEQGKFSAKPTDPSGFRDTKITKKLQEAYQTAKETIDQLFEEH